MILYRTPLKSGLLHCIKLLVSIDLLYSRGLALQRSSLLLSLRSDIANNQEGPSEQRTEAILETESNNEFTVKYVEKDPMTLGSLLTSNFVEGDCLRVDDLSPDVSEDSDDSQQVPYLSEEDSGDSFRVEEDTDDTHRVEECDVESESESDNVVVDQATGERILKLLVEPERGELNDDYKGIMRLVKAEKTPLKYMYKIIIDPLSGCNTSKELELIDRLCDVDIKVSSDVLSSPAILCGGGGLSADDETTSSNASEEKGSKKVAIAHSASAVASNEEHIIGDPVLQKCRVKTPCRTRPKRTEKCPKQWQDYLWFSDDKEGLPSYISVFHSHCGPPVQVSSGPPLAVIESGQSIFF